MARDGWPANPVIYQIYPRSFLDTTGSGTGDLRGIHGKLDHVAGLGVDAIWLAPFYPSPLEDGGYDVADHRTVDPSLGDLDDFDALVRAAHDRGLKVMIDQVLNHTSHLSDWFQNSIARQDGYDDWYVWRDPRPDGTPPNNWLSYFGPPAWTWNHRRQQYYWHQFLSCQPNLNLRNPAVQEAHKKQMQLWRARGVDGFRLDAVTAYLHDEAFRDNPPASAAVRERVAGPSFSPYSYQDHLHDLLPGDGAAYCALVRDWAGPDTYLLGEMNVGNSSIEISNAFTQPDRLDAAYTIDFAERGFTPRVIADVLTRIDKTDCAGRIAIWLSSHDQARHLSRAGDGSARDAKFLAFVCGVFPGPWLAYQGEELGLTQPDLTHAETTDPLDRLFWPDGPGRTGARVPLPWDGELPGYGFSTGNPWLPMRWSKGMDVTAQTQDAASVQRFYTSLIGARQQHGWANGTCIKAQADGDLLTLWIQTTAHRFQALINFGDEAKLVTLPAIDPAFAIGLECRYDLLPARSGAIWVDPPAET